MEAGSEEDQQLEKNLQNKEEELIKLQIEQ